MISSVFYPYVPVWSARLSYLVFCFRVHPVNTNTPRPLPKPKFIPTTIFFLLSPSFSSPCSSGVIPLILIYLMKCLKPPCGNPSTPIKRTRVLWLLRRQGHTLFFLTLCTLRSLASFVLCKSLLPLLIANWGQPSCALHCVNSMFVFFTLQDWRDCVHRWVKDVPSSDRLDFWTAGCCNLAALTVSHFSA